MARARCLRYASVPVSLRPRPTTAIMPEALERRLMWSTTPNDPLFGDQYGAASTNLSDAWDTTHGSAAVVVAHIDTGIDYTHEDLYLNVWLNQAEIPNSIRSSLVDTDGDGLI